MMGRYNVVLLLSVFPLISTALFNLGLQPWSFRRLASGGIDSGWNNYAWGMAVEGDVMIVGTNRYHENISFSGMVASGAWDAPLALIPMMDVEGSQYQMFTPQWAQDARAKLFKCTGVLSGHLTCQMVLQSGVACIPPGAPICPGMITIPSPGLCTPVSYGYRTVRRVSG